MIAGKEAGVPFRDGTPPFAGNVRVAFSPQQIASLAKSIVDGLARADLIELGGPSHAAAETAVAHALDEYGKAEAALAREAEQRADDEIRKLGRGGVGLDRRRVVQMIKQKLAAEKGFPI
jgi:hypothetical protein